MNIKKWLACSALTLPLAIGMQQANAQKVDPDKLPKVACSELIFSQAFLKQVPESAGGLPGSTRLPG